MGKKKRLKLERAEEKALAEKTARQPLSKGVLIFGILLIVSSLTHMHKLITDRPLYVDYYSYLPAWLLSARYAFSWLQRIAGILAGAGILARKEIARKLAFAIGAFTIATVYWKHPYHAVKLHAEYLDRQFGTEGLFASITPFSVAGLILSDIVFWAIFFYFFTRPAVKAQFKPAA